jgi:pimeloyl-ACP methyl ester carboxylesterase
VSEATVSAGGVDLCVETFGDPTDPAILLIAGAAASMDSWHPDLCRRLAAGGRFVVRYDHRDTGRSATWPPGRPGYTSGALSDDAVALVDQLAGGRAHLVGLSMGGGIAQTVAVRHPERVATLTLLSTSSIDPAPDAERPPMADRLKAAFANPLPEPDWTDRDAAVDYLVDSERPYAGPDFFDEAAVRSSARRTLDRAVNPASAANHWLLVGADDDAPAGTGTRLAALRVPTLVIHGTEDPLFPPGHGTALAGQIPGAELLLLDGVGHQAPPPSTWDVVVPAILRLTSG